jgi:hypothetical protein
MRCIYFNDVWLALFRGWLTFTSVLPYYVRDVLRWAWRIRVWNTNASDINFVHESVNLRAEPRLEKTAILTLYYLFVQASGSGRVIGLALKHGSRTLGGASVAFAGFFDALTSVMHLSF